MVKVKIDIFPVKELDNVILGRDDILNNRWTLLI
jgi:hypothetical protein